MRVGIGVDFHRLVSGRPLVLGGIELPFERGLLGHSDADVLTHALMDALLGAAGLGDLGRHFPDSEPRWENVSSLELLARVRELLAERGLRPGYADVTVVAQAPKLAPHFPRMRMKLAEALGCEPERIHLKATTAEGLGFVGRGEGIAAWAVALVI